ncbi:MAG: murein hydrolase activator EnvC family protein [Vicinamibacterales bacterium]
MIQRAAVCGVILFALHALVGAQTADRAQQEAQARRVSERIRALQREADRLAGQSRTVLGDLRALEVEQLLQVERVREARQAVARAQAAVEEAAVRLGSIEQQRVAQLPDLKVQLVDIYKRGRSGYARLLFGGSTMRDFGRATRTVAAIMRINEQRIAEHQRTLDESRREGARLEQELRGVQAREADALKAQAAADRALAARAALIAQIDARRDLNAQFAGELQVAYERLQQQVARIAAGASPEPVTVPLAPFRTALDWPVPGRIAVRFGQPSGRFGDTATRNGVEIAAPAGTPVQAIHPGTVSYAAPFTAFGNLVILDHGDNASSLYGYLASMAVAPGAVVDGGTELGRVGSAPAGPPALYFEMRVDGRTVDPVQWLRPR